jgi:hypothetical protein
MGKSQRFSAQKFCFFVAFGQKQAIRGSSDASGLGAWIMIENGLVLPTLNQVTHRAHGH